MSINWQEILFHFLGGLGLFLYSIKTMGDGLQQAAGDRLRFYIDKYTSNPFFGVLVGIGMTALIQSSSGVTVITVGLVSAGLLTLRQAIGIVMGANIGTTVTSFLIGFKLGNYALPMLFIGTGLTLLIQASSATIGILQNLYAGNLIDLQGALPVLFGDNIGTTITAIIASLGANIAAKRVAGAHVAFNVIGTVVCVIFLVPFTVLIHWFEATLNLAPEMTIAFAHGTFNITNTIVQFPFIGALAYFVTKIIPGEDEVVKYEPLYLDEHFIKQAPSIALGNAKKELLHLGNYAAKAFDLSYKYIIDLDEKVAEKGHKTEEAINTIDEQLTRYLIALSSEALSQKESEVLTNILDSSRDLERIGDHTEALLNLTDYLQRKNVEFSDAALKELEEVYRQTSDFIKDALDSVENNDIEKARSLVERHEAINKIERVLRKTHIKRLNKGECSTQAGVNFIDIISHYTRVSDHAMNLAEKVFAEQI
ncbi:sodium-dependent phosphate transporter [Streptococcus pneumoniae]|uniref:Na/Pi cotransporter family protein n=1 Tax=Streptococcus pneumoniae TaxID=1313 RepID=UPI0005DCDD22|nr:Na/Pi cotransporter family protein [Streptococcus pneumoniae]CIO51789.1 sodium-dependent phosphate transporter [Streptococcus pneumoniae]CIO75854.1 sodium-dependent phosphate transporter [Streptococcus pneumoniae]CJL88074.1 sodium-dependent phosphate transporter [Streptococcus pneumoniae]CJY79914.1 sodium-dependent phosphate transporter [Streptococcus pneumoniae]CKB98793.1 sodium-dependent phosphate transporter [Streptococcus pneumoniae]